MSVPGLSRAAELLDRVMSSGWIEPRDLAAQLVISEPTLEAYRSGARTMRLEHQLCLALYVIAQIPSLARQGQRLRGQVVAAMAFRSNETETHSTQPPRSGW